MVRVIDSNQVLGFGASSITNAYANSAMPNYTVDALGVFPCWDDLYIYQGQPQGIFYSIDGTAPNRSLTVEFYESHYSDSTQYYHFLVSFWENMPNVTTIDYLNMSDAGTSATVGIEAKTRE